MRSSADYVRSLRAQAEELRDAAESMKFRETRAALIILAESYDRMADELDSPDKPNGYLAAAARH
jgi:hypothetical protein